jgi:hypothetical protein
VDRASWRRGGGEREGSARSTYDGTLGTRPKLLGPVETLLVISRAAVGTYVAHIGSTEAHSSDKWCSRCSLGVHVVIFDGTLVNRVGIVGVGGHASSTNERRCVCGRSARETKSGHRKASATSVDWTRRLTREAIAVGNRVAPLEKIGQSGLSDGSSSVACIHFAVVVTVGRSGCSVCGHDGQLINDFRRW